MPNPVPHLASPGAHRDLVLLTFTESVWRALSALPSLGSLPAALFVELDQIIRTLASGRLLAAGGPPGGDALVRFAGQGGFEGFQVDLAGAIVIRLEGRLGKRPDLDLITRILPGALAGTLAAHPGADGYPSHETYRLAGTAMAAGTRDSRVAVKVLAGAPGPR